MPHRAMITFASFHLERDELRTSLMFDHIGSYRRILNQRSAYRDFSITAHQQHALQRGFASRLGFKAVHHQSVSRAYAVLLASRFNNCVHKLFPKKGAKSNHTISEVSTGLLAKCDSYN